MSAAAAARGRRGADAEPTRRGLTQLFAQVPTLKMHLYTLVQLAGLGVLYAVKSSPFSLALPFFLVMMVPLRWSLAYLFTPLQLRAVSARTCYMYSLTYNER